MIGIVTNHIDVSIEKKGENMVTVFGNMTEGYNEICNMKDNHPDMLMDVGIQIMKSGDVVENIDPEMEAAFLLLDGTVSFQWDGNEIEATRNSIFDEKPVALHVCKGTDVYLIAKSDAEVLIQKTTNDAEFLPKFYAQDDVVMDVFGDGVWGNTARRVVRNIFDYNNAPYSNMVLGELINYPGRWSSYIPHGHPQPEVYYYRFNRPEGFGAAFLGDEAFKIQDRSAFFIPGGPTHPQVAAPGFSMYYCWMIRHLKDNPWVSRDNDPRYNWLLEPDVKIWPEK